MPKTPSAEEMTQTIHALTDLMWKLQGRLNAMEMICLQTIQDRARIEPDPAAYMRQYVERAKVRIVGADVDDASKADRTQHEAQLAMDDFLADVLMHGGQM